MFTYFKLKKALGGMKLKSFNDFIRIVEEKEALKKENTELQNEADRRVMNSKLKYQENELKSLLKYQEKIVDMELKHSNELKSLNHMLVLEKEKMVLEGKKIIQEANEKARVIISEATQKAYEERSDLLDKNYGDLKNVEEEKAVSSSGSLISLYGIQEQMYKKYPLIKMIIDRWMEEEAMISIVNNLCNEESSFNKEIMLYNVEIERACNIMADIRHHQRGDKCSC